MEIPVVIQSVYRRLIVAGLLSVTMIAAALDRAEAKSAFLPTPPLTVSTIASNGDVNPYGVAFVPKGFPAGGLLNPGDLLVSNFNNDQNLQGTGTTIVRVTPTGHTSTFFAGSRPLGLSTGLAVLKAGFVLVANCPTNNMLPVPGCLPGSLLLIDPAGKLHTSITSAAIQGPWDFTVEDEGNQVIVFVSNVLTGTVSRLDLSLNDGNVVVESAVVIASLYTHRVDPATFEIGPTGLVYDHQRDILYVASTADNAVFAVNRAGEENQSQGRGQVIYQDDVRLHGALAMASAPNGDLLVSNSDEFNPDLNQPSEIVEFTKEGRFVKQLSVDPNAGGAFGLVTSVSDDATLLATVDDNKNTVTIWTIPYHRRPYRYHR
jgi:hypothetical protein